MKRIFSLLLAILILVSTLASCSLQHFSFNNGDTSGGDTSDLIDDGGEKYITKIEWAEMLGVCFGMDACISDSPYFTDVKPSNAAFAYVQSCVEWEVFALEEEKFNPSDFATVEFVIDSAIKASEADYSEFDSTLAYATSEGLLNYELSLYATRQYALLVLEWAHNRYENKSFVEYENIKYKDNLIDLTESVCDSGGKVVCDASVATFAVGDVIITKPTPDNPYGVARKITNIASDSNDNVVLETIEPEIGDLYEELDFAYVGTVTDPSLIQTPEGITLQGYTTSPMSVNSEDLRVTSLAYNPNMRNNVTQPTNKGKDLSFSIALSRGGKLTFSPEYEATKFEIEKALGKENDFDKIAKKLEIYEKTGYAQLDDLKIAGDTQTVKAIDKYTGGWEIEGSLALKNFYVETELKTKKLFGLPYGIKSFEYEIHYEVESSLSFSGYVDEEITIATVPIPLGGFGITIEVEIFASASFNGDIKIGTKISNTSTVKYTEKNGFKKTQSSQSEEHKEISVNFDVGFGGKATLKAFQIKLIDFELKVGLGFETSAKLTRVMRSEKGIYKYDGGIVELEGFKEDVILCIEGKAYFPTISLSMGTEDSLAKKLGIRFTWKIMDKKGATFKSKELTLHWEPEKGIVDECTIDIYEVFTDEDVKEELETDKQENQNAVGKDVMNVSHYAVSLSPGDEFELSLTMLPYGFTGYDIEWKTGDDSIVQIADIRANENSAGCIIKAVDAGVTLITIVTADGSHQLKCSITVRDDSSIDYNPLE